MQQAPQRVLAHAIFQPLTAGADPVQIIGMQLHGAGLRHGPAHLVAGLQAKRVGVIAVQIGDFLARGAAKPAPMWAGGADAVGGAVKVEKAFRLMEMNIQSGL